MRTTSSESSPMEVMWTIIKLLTSSSFPPLYILTRTPSRMSFPSKRYQSSLVSESPLILASRKIFSCIRNNLDDIINVMLISTVNNNKVFYTKKQIKNADDARNLQKELGWPSTQLFIKMISSNFVLNCKVNADDVDRAIKIYAPPLSLLRSTMMTPPTNC